MDRLPKPRAPAARASISQRGIFKGFTHIAIRATLRGQRKALIDSGVLKTTITEKYGTISAANLKRAHAMLESSKGMGKIVLEGF